MLLKHFHLLGLGLLAMGMLQGGLASAIYENSDLYDDRSSSGKSGVTTPREFFLPPDPHYEKLDLNEFKDYRHTIYSPYAMLQLYRAVQVGKTQLREGYYLVKIDVVDVPNPPTNILPESAGTSGEKSSRSLLEKVQDRLPWSGNDDKPDADGYIPPQKRKTYPEVNPAESEDVRPQVSFLIKRLGEIELVVPVYTSEPSAKKLKKGQSSVELLVEKGDPVRPQVVYLKYCARTMCYRSVPLEPGLIQ